MNPLVAAKAIDDARSLTGSALQAIQRGDREIALEHLATARGIAAAVAWVLKNEPPTVERDMLQQEALTAASVTGQAIEDIYKRPVKLVILGKLPIYGLNGL